MNTRIIHLARSRDDQDGMTLIELMIAMVVLTVGMAGALSLMMYALNSNNRNRQDTDATVLAAYFLRTISSAPAFQNQILTIYDCNNNSISVHTAHNYSSYDTSATAGPTLLSNGNIDFSSSYTTTGYSATYQVCKPSGQTASYDVRWNIQVFTANSDGTANVYAKMVTVGVVKTGSQSNTGSTFFSLPVTIRTIVGS